MFDPDKIYRDQKGAYVPEWFSYVFNFNGFSGAAPTSTASIQTQNDAPFVACRFSYFLITAAAADETVTAANQEIPDLRLQITDSATSKNFFYAPVQISLIAANDRNNDVWLPVPRIVDRGASLTASISSTKTYAAAYNLQLVMEGFKKLRIKPASAD